MAHATAAGPREDCVTHQERGYCDANVKALDTNPKGVTKNSRLFCWFPRYPTRRLSIPSKISQIHPSAQVLIFPVGTEISPRPPWSAQRRVSRHPGRVTMIPATHSPQRRARILI